MIKVTKLLIFFVFLLFSSFSVFSLDKPLQDFVLEKKAQSLFSILRCITCENQNIADSYTPMARDIRLLIRQKLLAGETEKEVVDFFIERYGSFILLKPQFNCYSVVLWIAPFFIFFGGFFYLFCYIFKKWSKILKKI